MAAIPNTIPLGGTIAPTDTTDVYATHMANYGKGGVHHVADLTERDAITDQRRTEGMLCTVEDDGTGNPKTYQLVGGTANENWTEFASGSSEIMPSTGVSDLPIGSLIAYMGTTIPDDYLECDGRAVSRTVYDQLFAVIGTVYGAGDGVSTFNLPDYRDKFVEGGTTAGTEKAAGLPNISGSFMPGATIPSPTVAQGKPDGAFDYKSGGVQQAHNYNSSEANWTPLTFDASKSNAIYGNSETVQPEALTARICIKYRAARAAEIVTGELDYDNAEDVKPYFGASSAITIPSNTCGWSGSGYGVETTAPMPKSGWLTVRQLTVDAKKSIICLTKRPTDTVWQGRASFPTDPTTTQMLPTFAFPVCEGDSVMIVCVAAASAAKTALSVATLIPYKTVAVCGRNGADGISGGVIDYSRYTNVDLTSSATNINPSSAANACWEVSTTAPYDGAVLVNMNLPDAIDSSHITANMYLDVLINNSSAGIWPVRVQSTQYMIYGVKKGDTIVSRVQYLKSVSSAKPDVFSFVFHPYANDNTYSTSELAVGKWIDGKTIYRKVVQGTTPSDSGDDDVIDLTSLSIDTLISLSGQINFGGGTFYPLSWPRSTSENDVIMHAYKIRLHITSSNLYGKPFFAIVEYTKTA